MPIARSFGSRQVTLWSSIQICWRLTSSRPAMALSRARLAAARRADAAPRNSPRWTSRSNCSRTLATSLIGDIDFAERRCWTRYIPCYHLDCAGGDAAHEPSAGDEVDEERNQRRQQGCRHFHVVFALAQRRVDHVVELHRHRQVGAAGEDQAEHVVVPLPVICMMHGDHDDDRAPTSAASGSHEGAPESGAVDPRRLEQLDRQRGVVVAEQQRHDRQREDHLHQHDAGQRARTCSIACPARAPADRSSPGSGMKAPSINTPNSQLA